MLENTKAVIFDLDGTLVDSMWIWAQIDIEYLGRYGYTPTQDVEEHVEGMSFTETAVYFKERFQLPRTVEEIKQDWLEMAGEKYEHEVPLKPGAASFLKRIKAQGMKIGIASSNARDLIDRCLNAHGVLEYFDCIRTSCEVAKGKPAPDVYLSVASSLGVEPEHCLVFEDIPMGILAGKNAGMRVCAVEDAFSASKTEEKKKLADDYIVSYDEIGE